MKLLFIEYPCFDPTLRNFNKLQLGMAGRTGDVVLQCFGARRIGGFMARRSQD